MISRVAVPSTDDLAVSAPTPIARPTMIQRWNRLIFVHWPFRPDVIQPLLPTGLEVDTCDGAAWIGLLPFVLTIRKPAPAPALPWIGTTPEANVRTYVRGPDGRRGIWFLSLEASRLGAVLAARTWYHLPYQWARMRLWTGAATIRYESRRRWPKPAGTGFRLTVSMAEAIETTDLTDLERFLMCRWRLYSPMRGTLAATQVEHRPWPLLRARLLHLEEDLLASHGLERPADAPLVHFSPGVETRFGPRRQLTE